MRELMTMAPYPLRTLRLNDGSLSPASIRWRGDVVGVLDLLIWQIVHANVAIAVPTERCSLGVFKADVLSPAANAAPRIVGFAGKRADVGLHGREDGGLDGRELLTA